MRRLLAMSWEQWRALPWYEQRALREGMARETNPDTPEVQQPGSPDEEAAQLAALGFSIS